MRIHNGYNGITFRNPVVTMGTFDGVHLGHRKVLERLRMRASETGGESVLVTFYPHPRQVLDKGNVPAALLSTQAEKTKLLEECGIDHLVVINFDHEFSNREACQFVEEVLVGRMGARHLIVGFNHRFGKNAEGGFVTVRECSERLNLSVELVEPLIADQAVVSSSLIRDALSDGRTELANALLGYTYSISGTVVGGRKLGRTLGFPTANISPDSTDKLIPKDGVYAVELVLGKTGYKGVMSIGTNPTVEKESTVRTLEVNIFNFENEAYGYPVKIFFRYRLRDQIVFGSLEDLASQIELDKKRAIGLLG